jgi:zinc and cadmium transporter
MTTLLWIIVFGFLMSLIALSGSVFLFIQPALLNKMILPLIAFAAGSLIGGAMFHMIPHAVEKMGNGTDLYVWLMAGFVLFMALEQFLAWHHSHTHSHSCGPLSPPHEHDRCSVQDCQQNGSSIVFSHTHVGGLDCMGNLMVQEKSLHTKATQEVTKDEVTERVSNDIESNVKSALTEVKTLPESSECMDSNGQSDEHVIETEQKRSLGYLILLADAVHNFLGGLFVGAAFVDSTSLGLSAWTAAALHEVPQELGDFAILVHGGWTNYEALLYNFLSALTFPLGGMIAYASSKASDITFLIPFAAGNFLYIGATDLIPEIKHHHGLKTNAVYFASFLLGAGLLLVIRIVNDGW